MTSPPTDSPYILFHAPGWIPQPVNLKSNGTFKKFGVKYPINPGDLTSITAMKQKLLVVAIRAISIKKASARAVNAVIIAKCLYNRGAYVGVLSSWFLAQCEELHKIFATEIRRRTKNIKSSQLENLFQPTSKGGQGYQRLSDIIQHRKRSCLNRMGGGRPSPPGTPPPVVRDHPPAYLTWLLGLQPYRIRLKGQCMSHQTDLPTDQAGLPFPPSVSGGITDSGTPVVTFDFEMPARVLSFHV